MPDADSTVLVIDDDPNVRASVGRLLRSLGVEVQLFGIRKPGVETVGSRRGVGADPGEWQVRYCAGFSYGFRPGRGAHDALDALCVRIDT